MSMAFQTKPADPHGASGLRWTHSPSILQDSITVPPPHTSTVTSVNLHTTEFKRRGQVWSAIWGLFFVFFSFGIGLSSACLYVLVLPFVYCFPRLKPAIPWLLFGAQLPYVSLDSMVRRLTLKEAMETEREF